MKLCLIGFGFLVVACGGVDSSLFDPATSTTTDPVADPPVAAEASAPPVTLPTEDAGEPEEEDAAATTTTCTGYADPSTTGDCHACTGTSCQANGCFGGWYCKLDTQKCVAKPNGC